MSLVLLTGDWSLRRAVGVRLRLRCRGAVRVTGAAGWLVRGSHGRLVGQGGHQEQEGEQAGEGTHLVLSVMALELYVVEIQCIAM